MAKFLLLIAVFIVVYLIYRSSGRRNAEPAPKGTSALPEDMVRCKLCGVHLPKSESVASRGEFFCSQEHLRVAGKDEER
ncbi:MAG: PP0621 family protein [Burkholderiales bacterium]